MHIASRRAHVEELAALFVFHGEDGHVEGATAQVEHKDVLTLLADVVGVVHAIRKRSGCRFIDDALDLQPGHLGGKDGGHSLRFVEGSGHRNHGLYGVSHLIKVQVLDHHPPQLAKYSARYILGRLCSEILLALLQLNQARLVRTLYHFRANQFSIPHNFFFFIVLSNESFDIGYCRKRVLLVDQLLLGFLADNAPFPVADYGRHGSVTVTRRDYVHDLFVFQPDRDARIGGA